MANIDPVLLNGDLCQSARIRVMTELPSTMFGAPHSGTGYIGKDPGVTEAFRDGWVFCPPGGESTPFREVEGTGMAAVVIQSRNSWGVNRHNTAMLPILQVLIYADDSRDAQGNIAARDAELRARYVARKINSIFHDAPNESHYWPGLYVCSCVASTGQPSLTDIPGRDGVVRAELRYEVMLAGDGDSTSFVGVPDSVLTGHGPPSASLNVPVGVEYVDLDTGDVYRST